MLGFMVGQATTISSATTTSIRPGPGVLIGYWIASGTTPSVQAYDNASAASGTLLHDTTVCTVGTFVPAYMQFTNGLTVVTAGTNPKVTVVWIPA